MSLLETPFAAPGRNTGTAGPEAAKNPKAKLGPGGRDERGQAFRSLLQNVDKAAKTAPQPKTAEVAPGETGANGEGPVADLLLEALVPAALPEPAAATSGTADAARLLLGALQTPAREAQPDSRKEPGSRRDAFAALNSALARAGTGVTADNAAGAEPGIAMPSDTTAPTDLLGLADLGKLSEPKPDAPGRPDKAAGELAPDKPLSITVVRQETHLPPVLRLSPLQQVAEPIRQASAELSPARTQEVPDLAADRPAGIAAPTKILHIQLSPVELGSIVVKLRISQGGMEVRLEASRAETAQMLANDREALREIVKASGYALDQVSVETVHVDQTTPDPRPGGQEAANRDGASEARAGARDGRGFDQSRQGERQEPQSRSREPDPTLTPEDTHEPREIRRPGRDPDRYL
ncbi:flagellar hook-length control protein FliK [Bosea sp. (in: a-proteobacteria)]|uniref:flagellar hook-length control protein FliK n=1 Tax=Bosea sp. (in: a-proteobacteria) TaxID=1871050 RepID=UPI0027369421|nr:flagellar hook-length control protein FliK [Bosea sp. (in: a-proteobacteria)]MDP3408781.1 flagellar hook-length control protein FliK [Bosea sp. (in: a-proteobacteria)]